MPVTGGMSPSFRVVFLVILLLEFFLLTLLWLTFLSMVVLLRERSLVSRCCEFP